jgi:hypothetical protein
MRKAGAISVIAFCALLAVAFAPASVRRLIRSKQSVRPIERNETTDEHG